MKVCGFTFIRNAIKFDYPIVEAITSVLPLCDELFVIVGNSEDETLKLIEQIGSPKIKIFESKWDESLRSGGRVLADETNKALNCIDPTEFDWAFYIQGDEIVHEKYHESIRSTMEKWKDSPEVEGLLFDYLHFYGSYDFIGDSTRWYRKEVRIIRPDPSIRSFRDAQGFKKGNRSLKVKSVPAFIYHYGWVKPPHQQQEKQQYFHSLWHDNAWIRRNIQSVDQFDYSKIDSVARFNGTHPLVMQKRIAAVNWNFSFDPTRKKLDFKSRFKMFVEKKTGWRVGEYKNYRII